MSRHGVSNSTLRHIVMGPPENIPMFHQMAAKMMDDFRRYRLRHNRPGATSQNLGYDPILSHTVLTHFIKKLLSPCKQL
uniref:Uncharacterized protein n=1 Tax=Ditylenchus dipsaci TaxID=166011 RepID=A0A915EAP5_9BILA